MDADLLKGIWGDGDLQVLFTIGVVGIIFALVAACVGLYRLRQWLERRRT